MARVSLGERIETMTHTHDHHHHDGELFHTHVPADRMRLAFFVTIGILVVEIVGAIVSNSLALLSDAGHVLTDVAAMGLAWYAMIQSQRAPTNRMTFGYHRTGIMAAMFNSVTLILMAVVILWQAVSRFAHPEHVHGTAMFVSAAVGLTANLWMGLGMRGSKNLNVKGAVMHMLGDAAASAAVIVGGVIIVITQFYLIDPLLSVLIALLVAYSAVRLLQQAVSILMESTPTNIELPRIANLLMQTQGVIGVHDLHIWSLASDTHALSCHVVLEGNPTLQESQAIVRKMEETLRHENIQHATIQTEDTDHLHDDSLLCHMGELAGH